MKKYKIDATLAYGKMFPNWLNVIVVFGLFLFIIMIPLLIYCAIDSSEYKILICFVMIILGIIGFSYVLYFQIKIKRKMTHWRKDAVVLWAETKELSSITNTLFGVRKYKIKIRFSYNNRTIEQESGELNDLKENIFYNQLGYDSIFGKYINKRIEILYSPQYNQIMLLKNANNK